MRKKIIALLCFVAIIATCAIFTGCKQHPDIDEVMPHYKKI